MKSLGLIVVSLGAVLAVATQASGGRHSRATAVFAARCASCHVIGWGEPLKKHPLARYVDLTKAAERHDAKWLKEWLSRPHVSAEGRVCDTSQLDPVQVDILVGYLTQHARPHEEHVVVPPKQLRLHDANAPEGERR